MNLPPPPPRDLRLPIFVLMLLVGCAVPRSDPPPGPLASDLPVVDAAQAAFDWQQAAMAPGDCDRSVDISQQHEAIALRSGSGAPLRLALHAVDPLVHPTLGGVELSERMPTESTVVVDTDGSLTLSYGDIYDELWRGRQPQWSPTELAGVSVDGLDDDLALPVRPLKVLRDADLSAVEDLYFVRDPEQQVTLHLRGELRYCFELGHAASSLALTDPSGALATTLQSGPGTTLRLNADGGSWQTVWTSEGEGIHHPRAALPPSMVGARQLCLAVAGPAEDTVQLQSLQITIGMQPEAGLEAVARLAGAAAPLAYADADTSSHHAIMSWDAADVTSCPAAIEIPGDAPSIVQQVDGWRIYLPPDVTVELAGGAQGEPGAIRRVWLGSGDRLHTVLSAAPGAAAAPLATLTMLDGDAAGVAPPFDWQQYVDDYLQSDHEGSPHGGWAQRFQRTHRRLSLAAGQYLGASVEQGEVVLRWAITDGGQQGTVEILFGRSAQRVGEAELSGVAVRVRVSGAGLLRAEWVTIDFPVMVSRGDWMVEQGFRRLIERRLSFEGVECFGQAEWFGLHQSFAMRSGPGRTVLGMFDAPVAAQLRLAVEGGRHLYQAAIPLGVGQVRTTPALQWLATGAGATDRFVASNAWSHVYQHLKETYSAQAGVLASRPVPTAVWVAPSGEQVLAARQAYAETGQPAPAGQAWYDWWVAHELPRAVEAGVGDVMLQAPWQSDGDSQPAPPPQQPWELPDPASLQAPWDLVVPPAFGGRAALGRLVQAAHQAELDVTLWFPSSLSLHSPLLEGEHPGWAAWRMDGVPKDAGWGDIVGLANDDAAAAHFISRVQDLHDEVPFDGAWMDSFAWLSILTDYAKPQPEPSLRRAVAMQKAMTDMGLARIGIEGLGPLGSPYAYGDYESPGGPAVITAETTAALERLRDHEYLLYRMGAGSYLDLPVYHRALAAGGIITIANFDEVEALGDADQQWLRRINLVHRDVVDQMQHRTLLHDGARWLGVSWARDDAPGRVIFAFDPFVYRPGACVEVRRPGKSDVLRTSEPWVAGAWQVYQVEPSEDC